MAFHARQRNMPPARRPDRARRCCLALIGAALAAPVGLRAAAAQTVTLFAAASTAEAVAAVAAAYAGSGRDSLRPVIAASSTLAQQILHGAPADLFLSANRDWMDHLQTRSAIEATSRIDLLGNRLVLIAPADSSLRLSIGPRFPLAAALGDGRLALGDPAHVPAGAYAVAALRSLDVWAEVAMKIAYSTDVRAALALVERGEAAAGVVYATDAAIARSVRVLDTFPAASHPSIVYPLAVVTGRGTVATLAVHAYLRGAEAQGIFRAHGFTPPPSGA